MAETPSETGVLAGRTIFEVLRLAGRLTLAGNDLVGGLGLTAARWQVLATAEEEVRTVAALARSVGLARQSVQRVVNDLAAEGLVALADNPADRRARLVVVTAEGSGRLAQADRLRVPWTEALAEGFTAEELAVTEQVLSRLRARLDRGTD
ncbi:MarR family transcriptional regulator [Primorskyibacter flagellatus]|uniref:MarR family transcriptional regulator n=1 Tax=Primorskyibacter flagellatus TaxID=1387277 RepID=A0A917A1X0_9RHOB|nr:MarR family transcriptional regulator [Primorskyibacter flagellatus]GGE20643.1 MarR family transcriptional regulator [Primorskyibacter flagellatus]